MGHNLPRVGPLLRVAAIGTAVVATLGSAVQSATLPEARVLTVEVAEIIAAEAMAVCRSRGYRATVLVVDAVNVPKVLLRDDSATASTAEVARMKASAAMIYNRPSGPVTPLPAGTLAPPSVVPGTINAYGGLPIQVDGITIGAVGISATPGGAGASGVDVACATAGLARVADRLR